MTKQSRVNLPFRLVRILGRKIGGYPVFLSRYESHRKAQPTNTRDKTSVAIMSVTRGNRQISVIDFSVTCPSSSRTLHVQSVPHPFLAARACEMAKKSKTNPAVKEKPPSQSTLLSARLRATARSLTPKALINSGIKVSPDRSQNAARHLDRHGKESKKGVKSGK
jgi:hypothetical protein